MLKGKKLKAFILYVILLKGRVNKKEEILTNIEY